MTKEFYSIITDIGLQKINEALNDGTKLDLKYIAVGDSNGAYYEPDPTQTKLKNLWEIYGTTSTTGSVVTFTEYSTDDVTELQNKIAELDKTIGFENIRVIADVTYNVGITVDEIKVDTTEPNPSEP